MTMYCKKFRLIDKLEHTRKAYVLPKGIPEKRKEKVSIERNFVQWDFVLEEVKWVAIDMMEERKAKTAIAALLSKKIKKEYKQRQTHLQEKNIYHRLIGSEMATMISNVFDPFREDRKARGDVKFEEKGSEVIKVEDAANGGNCYEEK